MSIQYIINTISKCASGLFLSAFVIVTTPSYASLPSLTSTAAQKLATKEILSTLDKRHFVELDVNDALSERFLENYLKRLDPNKSFFIQADIDEFSLSKHRLDDELKRGDNSTGFFIYSRLRERMVTQLTKVVDALKGEVKDIDFSIDESILVNADKSEWPKNIKDADEQWRKRIKSFFLAKKLSGETIEKSREQLLKQYSNQLERIHKNKTEDVYEIYINAFTELYDPHTNYFSPRTSENFSINMSLSLEGIGAVLQTEDEYTKVVRLVTAGPADKQGELGPADRITSVGQGNKDLVNVVGWRLDEVVDLIRGPKDSIVRLEVLPSASTDNVTKVIEIKRDKVKLEDQAAQKAVITLTDSRHQKTIKLGIIDIPTFYLDFEALRKRDPNYRSTRKDVERLLIELEQENVDGIIVDLRNNGGGSLYEATSVTDLFIDKGPVVQIGKDGGRKTNNYSQHNARFSGPLLVLINRLSASASEIFAGAIQDYNRGLIVGSPSFGKGTVQTLTPLDSQGELKITESKFYRVSGDSTQHRGVVPDIRMPELIDGTNVGESSYETALPWSKTQPVRHGEYFPLDNIVKRLDVEHRKRINENPDFIYLNDRKAILEEANNKETLSLKESTRLAEKARLEEQSLTIENKRREAKGEKILANFEALTEFNKKENEQRSANSGRTVIDTEDDAILKEAGYIHSIK